MYKRTICSGCCCCLFLLLLSSLFLIAQIANGCDAGSGVRCRKGRVDRVCVCVFYMCAAPGTNMFEHTQSTHNLSEFAGLVMNKC